MSDAADDFERRVRGQLKSTRLGSALEWFEQLPSTNGELKERAAKLPHGAVIGANRQTAGRGTHGRSWDSDSPDDLYFSLLLRDQLKLASLPLLALRTALAVVGSLRGLGLEAQIKWPNDVLLAGKKVSGILLESSVQGRELTHVVIGVGINVGRTNFEGTFDLEPTSVALESGQAQDRAKILVSFLSHLGALLSEPAEVVVEQAERCLAWRGERVFVDGSEGELVGLGVSGALRLRTSQGEESYSAGRLSQA